MKLIEWFRDFRRGYTDADALNAYEKIMFSPEWYRPDGLIQLTKGEMRAATELRMLVRRPSICAGLKLRNA